MKKIIVVLFCLGLMGCVEPRVIYRDVPVVVHEDIPAPAEVKKPELEIDKIKKDTPDKEVIKAYDLSITQLESYAQQLLKSLEPYKKAAEKNKHDNNSDKKTQ